ICVHPLPTQGGMMDSHLLRKAAWRLPALAGLAVLRFNTRGTSSERGTSEGAFDGGVGERHDVAAAIEYAEFGDLPAPWLVGWSFGTDLVLRYGCDPAVVGAVLISPPLRATEPAHLGTWAASGKPVLVLVPEYDDNLRPAEARERFAAIGQAEVVGVEGARHLLVGHAERVLDEIVARVVPGTGPLPDHYAGPVETGDTGAYRARTLATSADRSGPGSSVSPRAAPGRAGTDAPEPPT
ncbi:MAG TPA: hypothetical protein VGR21_12465, partial [Cryptosporangiaceae bacterium]|nr:hypothetical protein [Cryptosporangiaceae bacterium]